jgi:cytochrome c oxidase subunit 3
MMSAVENRGDTKTQLAMHPKKFAMWLFIVSICMIFAAMTSGYIVRQAEGNWRLFELPSLFLWSSVVLIASSGTMQWSYMNAKKDEISRVKGGIVVTLLLGITFLFMQWEGWMALVDINVHFSFSNPSESFLYVLTGLHAFHLVTGLIFIIIVLISTFQEKVHAKSLVQLEMCTTYWHFLDGLWLYLYIFLLIYR